MTKRIALIHAVVPAMQPVAEAFKQLWPDAECVNVLDDSLSYDREKDAELTPQMFERFATLSDYATSIRSHAILFTCSAFGEAIEAVARKAPFPVLKPNEAMFEAALERGQQLGMLATFQPSVAGMEEEFRTLARERGAQAHLKTVCIPDAMAALRKGDVATHNALLAEAADQLKACDAIMLAHFSTARALEAVTAKLDQPVLTSPASAVLKLKTLLASQ